MDASKLYHAGNRRLQDLFRQPAARGPAGTGDVPRGLQRWRPGFIEGVGFFFLATADAEGRPDCSFKGGLPGFVRVTGPSEIAFPDYDGNGMFKSLGNLLVNPGVGLLFIAMGEKPRRLRVNGTATVSARRSGARRLHRGAAAGAGGGAGDLPELPALHPRRRRPVGLRAAARNRAGRAGVEGVRRVPRRGAAAGAGDAWDARLASAQPLPPMRARVTPDRNSGAPVARRAIRSPGAPARRARGIGIPDGANPAAPAWAGASTAPAQGQAGAADLSTDKSGKTGGRRVPGRIF